MVAALRHPTMAGSRSCCNIASIWRICSMCRAKRFTPCPRSPPASAHAVLHPLPTPHAIRQCLLRLCLRLFPPGENIAQRFKNASDRSRLAALDIDPILARRISASPITCVSPITSLPTPPVTEHPLPMLQAPSCCSISAISMRCPRSPSFCSKIPARKLDRSATAAGGNHRCQPMLLVLE